MGHVRLLLDLRVNAISRDAENIKLIESLFQFSFILIDQYDVIVFFG